MEPRLTLASVGGKETAAKPETTGKAKKRTRRGPTTVVPDLELEPIPAILLQRASTHPRRVALRVKKEGNYRDITWGEYGARACELAAGLQALGLERGETVALQMANSPEFVYSDLGILIAGGLTVGIYSTTSAQEVSYILAHSESRFLIVDTIERFQQLKALANELQHLEQVIVVNWEAGLKLSHKIKVHSFYEVCQLGQDAILADEDLIATAITKIDLNDTAIVIYTSGTTGNPKGAMLSHRNISFIARALSSINPVLTEHETLISFLPMAHALERIGCVYFAIYNGSTVGFAERMETVMQDILEIQPTILYGVPRFYEKIYNGVFAAVNSDGWIKKQLFNWANKIAKQYTRQHTRSGRVSVVLGVKYWLADRLVFSAIKARLGGRVKYALSGGAPLSAPLSAFFYGVGLPILEAYGATETSAPATITRPEKLRFGTVGTPLPYVDVQIADDGEILIRGANVCKGYFRDPEATARAFVDGWYYSGDIGHFDREGNLVITDRKKEIIITSGGKNIPPQNIENILKTSRYINQVMVYGERRHYLTALITLDWEALKPLLAKEGLDQYSHQELVKHPRIYQLLTEEVTRKNQELANYERIKKFALLVGEFTVVDNELTPTLKLKRRVITAKYQQELNDMYEKEYVERADLGA
jgi:long-chain acyl-CoA synthetase